MVAERALEGEVGLAILRTGYVLAMTTAIVNTTAGLPRLAELRSHRQELSEKRLRLRREQAAAFSPELAATVDSLGDELRVLEDEERALRSWIRFGSREAILERAQRERRLLQAFEVRELAPLSRRIRDRPQARVGGSPAGYQRGK